MNIFFEPVNVNQWNIFEEVKGIGHVEPFLATNAMKIGDVVLLHVGSQNPSYASGVYAYGVVVKSPYILQNSPADYCNNKNTVDVEIKRIEYSSPIISHEDCKKYINQFRTVHCIDSLYFDEILRLLTKNDSSVSIQNLSQWLVCFEQYVLSNQESNEVSFTEGFLYNEEGYKQTVFDKSNAMLNLSSWNDQIIGEGFIGNCVVKALANTINLVNYNQITYFKNMVVSNVFETERVLYQIYCGNNDEKAFEDAVALLGGKYDLIATLFFIKDIDKYLPVRSSEFDKRFQLLRLNFTMTNKCSWDNYRKYLCIVESIKVKMQSRYGTDIRLIDAHSFLWLILYANEYLKASDSDKELVKVIKSRKTSEASELQKKRDENYPKDYVSDIDISKEQWKVLIRKVFTIKDVALVKRIYCFDNHAATCAELAAQDNVSPSAYITPVVMLGKRVSTEMSLEPVVGDDGSRVWWRIPFWGKYRDDGHFEWKLRPELADALVELYPELDTKKIKQIEFIADIELSDDLASVNVGDSKNSFEYNSKPKRKSIPVIIGGHESYPRDRKVAMNALSCANYKCEVDNEHYTFIRRNSNVNYTEPHHLIPMRFSDRFEHSLDVEENVVSLCSNCHNQIHYGRGARDLIVMLYEQRKHLLELVGLNVSLSELLKMYDLD